MARTFTPEENELLAGALGEIARASYEVVELREPLYAYVRDRLKSDVLQHNLSGWNFLSQESYKQYLEAKLPSIIHSQLQTHILQCLQEQTEASIQENLSDPLTISTLSPLIRECPSDLDKREEESETDWAERLARWSSVLVQVFGLVTYPIVMTWGSGALLKAASSGGVLGSLSAVLCSMFVLPFLHNRVTLIADVTIGAAVHSSVQLALISSRWWWSSWDIQDQILDGIVDNLLENFDCWYYPTKRNVDYVIQKSIENLESSFLERSDLLSSWEELGSLSSHSEPNPGE